MSHENNLDQKGSVVAGNREAGHRPDTKITEADVGGATGGCSVNMRSRLDGEN